MENQSKNRRKYDQEFKSQAVKQLLDGQPAEQVSKNLGVSQSLLYRWKSEQLADGASVSAKEPTSPAALEAQIRKLRAQLKQVEPERDILDPMLTHVCWSKKALSIFSRKT
jgi:transposase